MRHADLVRTDAENILSTRYLEMTGKVTGAIEDACKDGKFKAIVCFGSVMDQDAQNYLKAKLKDKGYGVNVTSYQRDGTTFTITWKGDEYVW